MSIQLQLRWYTIPTYWQRIQNGLINWPKNFPDTPMWIVYSLPNWKSYLCWMRLSEKLWGFIHRLRHPFFPASCLKAARLSLVTMFLLGYVPDTTSSKLQIKVSRAAWTICRDPGLYPNPDSFVPERYLWYRMEVFNARWLNLSRDEETQLWDQAMIFSYGPRVCLGKE